MDVAALQIQTVPGWYNGQDRRGGAGRRGRSQKEIQFPQGERMRSLDTVFAAIVARIHEARTICQAHKGDTTGWEII